MDVPMCCALEPTNNIRQIFSQLIPVKDVLSRASNFDKLKNVTIPDYILMR